MYYLALSFIFLSPSHFFENVILDCKHIKHKTFRGAESLVLLTVLRTKEKITLFLHHNTTVKFKEATHTSIYGKTIIGRGSKYLVPEKFQQQTQWRNLTENTEERYCLYAVNITIINLYRRNIYRQVAQY